MNLNGEFLRSEGDSNPRNAFDVYTLSRRASSTTRAPLHARFASAKLGIFSVIVDAVLLRFVNLLIGSPKTNKQLKSANR